MKELRNAKNKHENKLVGNKIQWEIDTIFAKVTNILANLTVSLPKKSGIDSDSPFSNGV